jgi:hypothetical protein
MRSILEQTRDFIIKHKLIIKTKPSPVQIDTMTYVIYDNELQEIVGMVNLSETQVDQLNQAFRHHGAYHMKYVILKILDAKGVGDIADNIQSNSPSNLDTGDTR